MGEIASTCARDDGRVPLLTMASLSVAGSRTTSVRKKGDWRERRSVRLLLEGSALVAGDLRVTRPFSGGEEPSRRDEGTKGRRGRGGACGWWLKEAGGPPPAWLRRSGRGVLARDASAAVALDRQAPAGAATGVLRASQSRRGTEEMMVRPGMSMSTLRLDRACWPGAGAEDVCLHLRFSANCHPIPIPSCPPSLRDPDHRRVGRRPRGGPLLHRFLAGHRAGHHYRVHP